MQHLARINNNFFIRLTRTFFQLGITNPDSNVDGLNDECFEPERLTTSGRSEDFLFISHASVEFPPLPNSDSTAPRTLRPTHFCGISLTRATTAVISTPPGPFSIQFNADDQYHPGIEIGFRLQYEVV